MRLRMLGAAAVAVLAASTLSACRSNVGFALEVDGHSYSESDVSSYITPQAVAVGSQSNTSVSPKPFVVEILILGQLTHRIVDSLSTRKFDEGELQTVEKSLLAGKSTAAFAAGLGVKGYTGSFYKLVLREQVFEALINEAGQNAQAAGQQLNIDAIASKLNFQVRINPRYGSWDAKKLLFDSSVQSTLPSFLKLKSTVGTTTTQTQTSTPGQ